MSYASIAALRNSVSNDLQKDIEIGLEKLLGLVSDQSRLYKKVALQNGSYRALLEEKLSGRISFKEYDFGRSQILSALLAYLEDLELDDLKQNTVGSLQELDWQTLNRQGLDGEVKLLVEKTYRLREALALEDDPTRQMRFEKQIQHSETRLKAILEQIKQS